MAQIVRLCIHKTLPGCNGKRERERAREMDGGRRKEELKKREEEERAKEGEGNDDGRRKK